MSKWILLRKVEEIEINSIEQFEDKIIVYDKVFGKGNWEIRRTNQ